MKIQIKRSCLLKVLEACGCKSKESFQEEMFFKFCFLLDVMFRCGS